MSQEIDSALWTGRTCWWSRIISLNYQALFVLFIQQDRDAREGQRRPVYGLQLGAHWHADCRGVTLYWNMREWRWLRPLRRPR